MNLNEVSGAGAAAGFRGPAPFPQGPGERSSGREGAPAYIQVRYEDVVRALVEILHTLRAPVSQYVIYSAEDVVKTFQKHLGLKVNGNTCEIEDHGVAINVCLGVLLDGRHVHITVKRFVDEKGNELNASVTFVATIPQEDLNRRPNRRPRQRGFEGD